MTRMPKREMTSPPLPRKLQVEVTAACNLSCQMCIVHYRPALPRSASMSFGEFQRLLDSLPSVEHLVLQGIGEPLLAPDLLRMVEYAKQRGIFVEFNTNATLLSRETGRRLIEAGLDALHISLDGASKETYETIRERARWEQVEANIRAFLDEVKAHGAGRPGISLVMVLMRRNLRELPELVGLAAEWGIPELFVQNLSHDFSDAPAAAYQEISDFVSRETVLMLPREEVATVFAEASKKARELGVRLRLPNLSGPGRPPELAGRRVGCDWPWQGGYVSSNGSVLPCCMVMGSDRISMGNLKGSSFQEIWKGKAFRDFRQRLLDGSPHPVCRGCSLYRGRF
ncbi:MAG TPA: radical SAM protein [Dehalococcoidia bacterium]|nr:radical SAM protein [Dehalococcoidia bacterium]